MADDDQKNPGLILDMSKIKAVVFTKYGPPEVLQLREV